ncbi:MAG TPA: SAM-dependent methyltransferase, partial [Candidatus Dormibacteraeota bacterium]|nr:SAM-dependent methyltransferase [Candidatus Dormibacteraeota bacterium]
GGPGFCFAGYLPRKPGELRRFFESLRDADRPTVAFESPHRVRRALQALGEVLPERPVALARELTKLHEEVLRGTAAEVLDGLGERVRGEITLVISHEPH